MLSARAAKCRVSGLGSRKGALRSISFAMTRSRRATSVTAVEKVFTTWGNPGGSPPAPDSHRNAEHDQQDAESSPKQLRRETLENRGPDGSADHDSDGAGHDERPDTGDVVPLRREVHRQSGSIDEQAYRGSRRDERLLRNVKAEHGGGSDAALIADETPERAR